jgi:hypothetical protein
MKCLLSSLHYYRFANLCQLLTSLHYYRLAHLSVTDITPLLPARTCQLLTSLHYYRFAHVSYWHHSIITGSHICQLLTSLHYYRLAHLSVTDITPLLPVRTCQVLTSLLQLGNLTDFVKPCEHHCIWCTYVMLHSAAVDTFNMPAVRNVFLEQTQSYVVVFSIAQSLWRILWFYRHCSEVEILDLRRRIISM